MAKRGSSEMGADVVGIPESQLHFDIHGLHVGSDVFDPDARAKQWWPEMDPATQSVRGLGAT